MNGNKSRMHQFFIKSYLWVAELLYQPFAWAYDFIAWLVSFGRWSQWRRDALGYLLPGNVLELGFGTGELLFEMARLGIDAVGVDVSKPMQSVTRRKQVRKGIYVKHVCGRSQSLPFSARSFTNILSTFPSNYIVDLATLKEVSRVLDSGGRWVIIGLGVSLKSRLWRMFFGWIYGDLAHSWVNQFAMYAKKSSLSLKVLEHDTDQYCLPVLILEPKDDWKS